MTWTSRPFLHVLLLCLATAGVSCRRTGGDPVEPEGPPHHAVSVHSESDLEALSDRYRALAEAGGPFRLEIELGPGPFQAAQVALIDPSDRGESTVVLRGDPANPAIFRGTTWMIQAGHVEVRHVVFEDAETEGALLDLRVREGAHFERVAWVGNRLVGGPGQAAVRLVAGYGHVGQEARFRDAWFVANEEEAQASLLLLTGDRHGGAFGALVLEDTAWVSNDVHAAIRVGQPADVRAEDLLVLDPRPARSDSGYFLQVARDGSGSLAGVRGSIPAVQTFVNVHPSWDGNPVIRFLPDELHLPHGLGVPPPWFWITERSFTDEPGAWDVDALTARARRAAPVEKGSLGD